MGWLILAAGRSRRFYGDKLLCVLPNSDKSVLEHTVRAYLDTHQPVHVVIREQHEEAKSLLNSLSVSFSVCPDSHLGMGHSLACGVQALEASWSWMGVALADMPKIQSVTLNDLLDLFLQNEACIVRPKFEGSGSRYTPALETKNELKTHFSGHPVIFPQSFFSTLKSLTGDVGAKSILEYYKCKIRYLKTSDSGVLIDVDTREQMTALV